MLSDFLTKYRDLLIKMGLIAGGMLLIAALVYSVVEHIKRVRSDQRIEQLDRQYLDADAKAKDAQAQADAMKMALDLKYSEIEKLEGQAAAADATLKRTQAQNAPLKMTYEEARNNSGDLTVRLTCADVCTELAEIGHPRR